MEAKIEKLHSRLENMLEAGRTKSVSVGILYHGKVYYLSAGNCFNTKKKIDCHTVYGIGSTTRAVTAELFCLLERDGLVDLGAPVCEILPELHFSSEETTQKLTIRDILSQRSGVSDHWCAWYAFPDDPPGRQLEKFFYCETAPVGERMRGCPSMAVVLEEICRRAAGKTWEQLVEERFLRPLGMAESYTALLDIPAGKEQAGPYELINGEITPVGYDFTGALTAACAVASTSSDLLKYLRAHLQFGNHAAAGSLKQCFGGIVPLNTDDVSMGIRGKAEMSYGMGWYRESYCGHANVFSAGYVDGFSSYIGFMPEDDLAIAVLCNTGHSPLTAALPYTIIDELLGLPSADHVQAVKEWIQSHMPPRSPLIKTDDPPCGPLRVCGVYRDELYGKLEFQMCRGTLVGQYGMFELDMMPLGGTRYAMLMGRCSRSAETHDTPFPARFVFDRQGSVTGVEADFGARRFFRKL